jgi:hypothetical protein
MTKNRALAWAVLALGFTLVATPPAAEAVRKNCRKLCRPTITRICNAKYRGTLRRLCKKEGRRELIPRCKRNPNPRECV